jgi:hypothetical protein
MACYFYFLGLFLMEQWAGNKEQGWSMFALEGEQGMGIEGNGRELE